MPNMIHEWAFAKGFAAGAVPTKAYRPYRIFREHWEAGFYAGRAAATKARDAYRKVLEEVRS